MRRPIPVTKVRCPSSATSTKKKPTLTLGNRHVTYEALYSKTFYIGRNCQGDFRIGEKIGIEFVFRFFFYMPRSLDLELDVKRSLTLSDGMCNPVCSCFSNNWSWCFASPSAFIFGEIILN